MPQYVALKTFKGKFGPVNRGMTYTLPDAYARELQSKGLVRPYERERSAPQNAALEGAPQVAGADVAGEDTEGRPAGGVDALSSASLQVRPSRRKTAGTSRGARK